MRSTLACQWCRSAKIKCHHDGSPPCRSCRLNPGRDCVLSIPKYRSKRGQGSPRVRRDRFPRTSGSLEGYDDQTGVDQSPNGDIRRRDELDDPLTGLDKRLLEHAFHIFVRLFPEFAFFHQPTFVKRLDDRAIPTVLLCGILSLSARFIPEIVTRHGSPAKASQHFAGYVRQNIMGHATAAMDIHTGQTLLMLSLYDWGNGDGSRAWIYNGMATRIVHGVYAQTKESARGNGSPLNSSRVEEACRTVWACFLLDTMIGCGKCQASNFSMSTSVIPLPLGEDHFSFGDGESCQPTFLNMWDLENNDYQGLSSTDKMGCDQSLTLIIQGFYIWQTISAWVSTGGRRRESPSSRKPPWHGSSFWSRSMAAVEDWRTSQSPQLIYSACNVNLRVYISRGDGERFAVINLLYFLNLIFLHREYIPFIPNSINRPQGPIDPPLLMEDAPPGWWDQSAQGLFAAASNIIQIMQELDQRGVQFQTPFTSFCVFTAATSLAYANSGPHMAPGLDAQHTSDLFSWASAWLNRACKVWKVSNGWYRTILTLRQLYTQSKVNPAELVNAGREMFPRLADNIQRLAGSEMLEVGDIPTANILLLLQRQQEQKENKPIPPALAEIESDPLGEMMLLPSDFIPDQDLFTSILSDPSGDRIRPFFEATPFAPP